MVPDAMLRAVSASVANGEGSRRASTRLPAWATHHSAMSRQGPMMKSLARRHACRLAALRNGERTSLVEADMRSRFVGAVIAASAPVGRGGLRCIPVQRPCQRPPLPADLGESTLIDLN